MDWVNAAGSFQMFIVLRWLRCRVGGAIAFACSLSSVGADCKVVATAADSACWLKRHGILLLAPLGNLSPSSKGGRMDLCHLFSTLNYAYVAFLALKYNLMYITLILCTITIRLC